MSSFDHQKSHSVTNRPNKAVAANTVIPLAAKYGDKLRAVWPARCRDEGNIQKLSNKTHLTGSRLILSFEANI